MKLYVAIDGPRPNREDDIEKREEVIRIVKNVDWDCETHYLIHDKNLGCSLSGFTAWKWFFEYEEFHFKNHICYSGNLPKRIVGRIKH